MKGNGGKFFSFFILTEKQNWVNIIFSMIDFIINTHTINRIEFNRNEFK